MRSLRSRARLEVLEVAVIVALVIAGPVLILRPRSSEAQASVGGFCLAAALVGALTLLDAKRREGAADKARHDAGRERRDVALEPKDAVPEGW